MDGVAAQIGCDVPLSPAFREENSHVLPPNY